MKHQCCAYTGDTGHERCTEIATLLPVLTVILYQGP